MRKEKAGRPGAPNQNPPSLHPVINPDGQLRYAALVFKIIRYHCCQLHI
jgi:hypothetical protein